MIKLSLRRHKGRVNQSIRLEVDVSLYCLRSVCHEPALASVLVAKLRDVRLKHVDLRVFAARQYDRMMRVARVIRGIINVCHWIFSSIVVSVIVFAGERIQEVARYAVDWCTSGSRVGRLADPNAEKVIEPIVLVNTQESDEYDLDQTPGVGISE